MKTKKRLKQIENKNYEMGLISYKKFKKTGGLADSRTAQGAFNIALKAIKYRLMFKS